jgi:nucleoside 2-deoxyribosyltransferase
VIKRETKRSILDHFDMESISFSGRMGDLNFLQRLYPLKEMKSHDSRYENAYGDIVQHTENNNDYQGNWVFEDERFELIDGPDEKLLKFLCEMAHPLVRPDHQEAEKILAISNDWLREDGWELYPTREIAGGKVISFQQINAVQKPKEDEVAHIWSPDRLRFFVSHRDAHKAEAKKLAEQLGEYGVSSFVAHDSIQAMSTWKNEIMKALQTMDACLCFITNDFYESEWTNQEVGFALARNVPIYLYSVDRTDPRGFKLDTQAIKTGVPELIKCITRDFASDHKFKAMFIDNFVDAVNGNWENAKKRFYDLVDFKFNDSEIERIVAAFSAPAKYSNQLTAILYDQIKPEHKTHPKLRRYTYYRECLDEFLKQHSRRPYSVVIGTDERGNDRVEIRKRGTK